MIDSKNSFRKVFKSYSLWFCLFAFCCVIIFFIINNKSMYTITDGIYQQYVYFMYTGKWIRMFFHNIFIDHVFELPMWDMTIGMGGDSIITFSSVANPLADPMYWISAFIPYKAAEYVFDAVIILKLYAAGLSFSYFAYCKKNPVSSIVAGAMVYAFSSVIFIGFTQVSFINIYYLFPLLMTGVDRLWTRKGYKLYVVMLALNMINSYYFTYMMSLLILLYCALRFIAEKELHSVRTFIRLIIRFITFTIPGIAIGLGLQLPAMIHLAGIDRLAVKWETVFFSLDTVKSFFLYAFTFGEVGREGTWGIAPIALLALICLFSEKNNNLLLKAAVIIYTLAFFFPVIGSVFNGFNFPTGRYVFGYLFLLAYVVTLEFEGLFKLGKNKLYITTFASLIYLLVTALFSDAYGVLSGISLLIFTGSLIVISKVSDEKKRAVFATVSVLFTCTVLGYTYLNLYLMPTEKDFGESYDYILNSNGLYLLNEDEYSELHHTRYDFVPYVIDDVPLNSSMLLDINGYDYYNTNYNNDIDIYYTKLAVNSNSLGFMMNGIRGRNFLELMNGTRFLSAQNDRSATLFPPYSYELLRSDNSYAVYESSRDASLVYFYNEAAARTITEDLDPIDTEELMMNYCILDNSTETPSLEPGHTEVDFEITQLHDITFTGDNTFSANTGSYITLSFDDIENSEVCVYLNGLYSDRYGIVSCVLRSDEDIVAVDTIENQSNVDNMYYHWKDTYMINYGFVNQSVNSVRLVFLEGTYTINDIKIYARNTEQLDEAVNSFYDHADMDNVTYEISGNHIHITANADQDKYLFMAVPYSEGWHAEVDGEEVEIMKANIGFMAIPVTQGEHTVELSYRTPYLIAGLGISLFFLVVFLYLPDKLVLLLGFGKDSEVVESRTESIDDKK